mgnify:CR=1 FL=1
MPIYVFSYNRGKYLNNLLKSLRLCAAGYDVVIVDDNSDDQYTLSVIEKWKDKFSVLTVEDSADIRLGGLYNNMRLAFKDANSRKAVYAMFIQDDMQFTREILDSDLANFEKIFDLSLSALPFLCFIPAQ